MRILLVGGSKSGKSSLAQDITIRLAGDEKKYYWATMVPVDHEDDERIERHIADRRDLGFTTIECGKDILSANPPEAEASVLFDSVTALLANEMFSDGFDPDAPGRVLKDLLALSERSEHFICAADEIFCDGYVYDDMTEAYRYGLARILRGLAERFDAIAEVTCGIPNVYKGDLPV